MNGSSLKQEIKQKKPFASPAEEAYLNILRTHGILQGHLSLLLKQYGLTQPQYNILRILRGAGSNGLPCLEIANRMVTREPDITRLLDRIEKSGWIRRSRSTTDRRVVIITITTSGLAALRKLDRPIRRLHRQMLGHLTRDDLKEISRLMAKVRNVS
jgi:DNA-binding MarR family transcriptional regulator